MEGALHKDMINFRDVQVLLLLFLSIWDGSIHAISHHILVNAENDTCALIRTCVNRVRRWGVRDELPPRFRSKGTSATSGRVIMQLMKGKE